MTNIELMMQQIEIRKNLIKNKIHQMKAEAEQQIMLLAKDDYKRASICAELVKRYATEIDEIHAQIESFELVIHLLSMEGE